MNKIFFLLAFLSINFSIAQSAIHEVTYFDVPREKAKEFIAGFKKIIDFNQGKKRTVKSTWLFAHNFGSGFSFMSVDLYENEEASNLDKAQEQWRDNLKKLNEKDRKAFQDFWREFNPLYFNNHTDERRRRPDWKNYFNNLTPEIINNNPIVVFSSYNPKYSDNREFNNLLREVLVNPTKERGNAVACFPTSHITGGGTLVHTFTWYKNWNDFAKEEQIIAKQIMDDKMKRFWEIAGDHSDNIMTLVGTNSGNDNFYIK